MMHMFQNVAYLQSVYVFSMVVHLWLNHGLTVKICGLFQIILFSNIFQSIILNLWHDGWL